MQVIIVTHGGILSSLYGYMAQGTREPTAGIGNGTVSIFRMAPPGAFAATGAGPLSPGPTVPPRLSVPFSPVVMDGTGSRDVLEAAAPAESAVCDDAYRAVSVPKRPPTGLDKHDHKIYAWLLKDHLCAAHAQEATVQLPGTAAAREALGAHADSEEVFEYFHPAPKDCTAALHSILPGQLYIAGGPVAARRGVFSHCGGYACDDWLRCSLGGCRLCSSAELSAVVDGSADVSSVGVTDAVVLLDAGTPEVTLPGPFKVCLRFLSQDVT